MVVDTNTIVALHQKSADTVTYQRFAPGKVNNCYYIYGIFILQSAYSQRADSQIVRKVQRVLHRIATHSNKKRKLNIFLDKTALSARGCTMEPNESIFGFDPKSIMWGRIGTTYLRVSLDEHGDDCSRT
jgi:hypothetical protein